MISAPLRALPFTGATIRDGKLCWMFRPGAGGAGSALMKRFDVTAYGAANHGRSLAHQGINTAIRAAHQAGGGVVVVPAGHLSASPFVWPAR
jgi:polygalacturonase